MGHTRLEDKEYAYYNQTDYTDVILTKGNSMPSSYDLNKLRYEIKILQINLELYNIL